MLIVFPPFETTATHPLDTQPMILCTEFHRCFSCFQTVDCNFILSFTYRFGEFRGATTYFAFCYPWSYAESQDRLASLDMQFMYCKALGSHRYVYIYIALGRNCNSTVFKKLRRSCDCFFLCSSGSVLSPNYAMKINTFVNILEVYIEGNNLKLEN